MDDHIATLVGVAGVNETTARNLLELTNGDVEQAAALFFDNPEVVANMNNAPPEAAAAPRLPPIQRVSGSRRPNRTGREDDSGVIHIDSDDDDDDIDMLSDDPDDHDQSFTSAQAAAVARSAQEEEDAAMAKRMQEELYGSGPAGGPAGGEDDVRAPIQRTTETLLAPSYGDDMDRDQMEAAVLEQLRRRQHRPRTQNNPFNQTVWDSAPGPSDPANGPPASASVQLTRQARLAELFRPPTDLIAQLTWDQARADGREDKKWILVNIQDMSDFNCQVLNRDVWKNDSIRQLVQESFIFLQYTKDDHDAQQYINYYLANGLHENPDNYPHVAIVDPRTGEQVKVWSGRPFPDVMEFYEQLAEFLDRYSLAANSKNPVAKTKPREKTKDVDRMTEEEMLEMAMQASLQTTNGTSAGPSRPSVQDPDLLTSSVPGLATPAAEAEASAEEESAFKKIAAIKHTEPANSPTTTTRIQFRHATGRIIRRFAINESVENVYQWLKAEPLEGKEDMEFELKLMPQGHDLIGDLDKTVVEAGLKQATVMIEYIEP